MKRGDYRLHLLLAAVLPSLLMATTLGVIWWNWTENMLESALRERVVATAKQLAIAAELPLFSGDVQNLHSLIDGIGTADAELLAIAVTDRHGTVLVHYGQPISMSGALPKPPGWRWLADNGRWRLVMPVAPEPIYIDDMIGSVGVSDAGPAALGYVVFDVSLQRLNDVRNNMLFSGAGVILLAILVSLILMARLARSVIRPLSRIIEGIEAMGKGELDRRIENVPGEVFEPLARVINQMADGVQMTQNELQRRIEFATRALQLAKTLAEQEARVDPLTGLYNRRAFMERASDELLRARRYNTSLALAMIDLDHFKLINDRFGHAVGDQVLVAFAETLEKSMRAVDIVARVGGEEFVLLMTETRIDEAIQVAERLRLEIAAASLPVGNERLHWTASLGVAFLDADDISVSSALVRADQALYRAKEAGRNRVEVELKEGPTEPTA